MHGLVDNEADRRSDNAAQHYFYEHLADRQPGAEDVQHEPDEQGFDNYEYRDGDYPPEQLYFNPTHGIRYLG